MHNHVCYWFVQLDYLIKLFFGHWIQRLLAFGSVRFVITIDGSHQLPDSHLVNYAGAPFESPPETIDG